MSRKILELSKSDRVLALELSAKLVNLSNDGAWISILTDDLSELPSFSGVYAATTQQGKALYIGKADSVAQRCNIASHHKLKRAIEQGARTLKVAAVPKVVAWHVEQRLIAELSPTLNKQVTNWWIPLGERISNTEFRVRLSNSLIFLIRAIAPFKNAGRDWSYSDIAAEAFTEWLQKPENQALIRDQRLKEALLQRGLEMPEKLDC